MKTLKYNYNLTLNIVLISLCFFRTKRKKMKAN
jgi:hypothetical protein